VLVQFKIERGLINQAILGPGNQFLGWEGARDGGVQQVTLLTDTDRLSKGKIDLSDLLASQGANNVAHGKAAGAALAAQNTQAIVLDVATGLTPQQGATLFTQQVEEARKVGTTLRAAMPQGAKAVTMGIDGRLALASVIVQTIGILNGRQAVAKAKQELAEANEAERKVKDEKLWQAQLGYMDSLGGLVAGSLDTLRVASEVMKLQRSAATGAAAQATIDASRLIQALKFGAQLAGVFGGFLNGYVSYLKAGEAREKELRSIALLHWSSVGAFVGTGVTSLVGAGIVGAEFIVARQVGSKAVQGAAARFVATRVAGMAVGAAVPVIGWVLLGVGIAATVGAALLEPTQLEAWARQTPFGKGPDGKKFKTLEEQKKALDDVLGLAAQPTEAAEVKAA
jgi:hypothetical protein